MRPSIILFLAVFLTAVPASPRRTSKAVAKEKQETVRKIENTRRQLDDNAAKTTKELRNLQSIEGQMREKQKEAGKLRDNSAKLRKAGKRLSDSIDYNSRRLEILRKSYIDALRTIRNNRHLTSPAAYVLSSGSFAQARSRIRYLRELNTWQREKARSFKAASVRLSTQRASLDSLNSILRGNLDSIAMAEQTLREQKNHADAIVGSLRRQGKNLGKVLREQERLAQKLDDELNRIIEEEARQNKKKTEKDKPKEKEKTKLSGSFAANKGKLPSPLDRPATVVSDFGRHSHSELEKVQMQNNGIDFETSRGAHALAVFPGTVSMVIVMEGYGNVVLLRHGDYLTVYAGIDGLKVRKGQAVEAGQPLGTVFSDPADNNRTRLHFEVRHEKEKLNPAVWLREQ